MDNSQYLERNFNSIKKPLNSKEIINNQQPEKEDIQRKQEKKDKQENGNFISHNPNRQLSKDQNNFFEGEKLTKSKEVQNPFRDDSKEKKDRKLAIKDSLAASYNFQIIDNKKKQSILRQNDLEFERNKLDQIRLSLEKEKEIKLQGKEKVKEESLKLMQMKLKEKQEQKSKRLNDQKVQQLINEEKIKAEIEKEIQLKMNYPKSKTAKDQFEDEINQPIITAQNQSNKKEDEFESIALKNYKDKNEIQQQNINYYELIRKQNLINARKVNEEIINQKKLEKDEYKKKYLQRAEEGIQMALKNETYNKIIKDEKQNEQKKYNEFLKYQISMKNNFGKSPVFKNDEISQNKRINIEQNKNPILEIVKPEVMIPGIFNLSSIGSKPTCRGARMIMNSLDMYQGKINDNLRKLDGSRNNGIVNNSPNRPNFLIANELNKSAGNIYNPITNQIFPYNQNPYINRQFQKIQRTQFFE